MIRPKLLDAPRLVRIIKYLAPALLLFYFLSDLEEKQVRDRYAEVLRSFKDEKKLFVSDLLENEVDGRFDGAELARVCAGREWHPEDKALILTCSPMPGGVGEVKNGLLHCIRFAIEIGAQLVLPRITRRSPADISNLNGEQQAKGQPVDYMFSSEHLLTSLQSHCPQMRVYRSLDDLYDKPSLLKPLPVSMGMLTDDVAVLNGTYTSILAQPQNITRRFADFYERELPLEKRHYPVRVDLQQTVFTWPVHYDGEAFRRDFGRLLRVRDDVRLLAASGLWELAHRFGLHLDPRRGIAHNPAQDKNPRFVGAHLRTEKDTAPPPAREGEPPPAYDGSSLFPGYDAQATYFLDYLAASEVPGRVVYLSTGLHNEDGDVRRFTAKAAELGVTVVTKRDVLSAGEVAVLNNRLTWDQRSLVDYEIMLRAGFVLGIVESSFAWNLALRRGNAYGGGSNGVGAEYGGFMEVPSTEPGKPGVMMWQDRYSKLFGDSDRATVLSFRPPTQSMLKRIFNIDDKCPQGYISSYAVQKRSV
ncbi:alternative oxidase [Diaporthe eres]|nr:alternative oxidase [Diaporthe eres]